MSQWNTIGHASVKGLLDKQLSGGRVSHAYLFLGPEGVGKRTLAEEFATKLSVSTHSILRHTFVDTGMAELRELLSMLSLRPSSGTTQVAILDGVEHVTQAEANALLKTLEEPTPATTLILISSERTVPATVLSRCQVLSFGLLEPVQLQEIAKQLGVSASEAAIVEAAGKASRLTNGQESAHADWKKELTTVLAAPVSERIALATKFAAEETDILSNRLVFWLEALKQGNASDQKLGQRLAIVWEGWQRLRRNGNKKLVLEYVCLNI